MDINFYQLLQKVELSERQLANLNQTNLIDFMMRGNKFKENREVEELIELAYLQFGEIVVVLKYHDNELRFYRALESAEDLKSDAQIFQSFPVFQSLMTSQAKRFETLIAKDFSDNYDK